MNDVEAHTVELLLQYMYGCLQPDLSLGEAVALFEASDMYAMASLHRQCARLLKSLITFHNVFELADVARLHNCPSLLQVRLPVITLVVLNMSVVLYWTCLYQLSLPLIPWPLLA